MNPKKEAWVTTDTRLNKVTGKWDSVAEAPNLRAEVTGFTTMEGAERAAVKKLELP